MRVLPSCIVLNQDLRELENELQGWRARLAQPGVKGSHAVGMLTMAFGAYEELLRNCLFLGILRHGLGDRDVKAAANAGKKPLEKQPLGKIIACLRAVRTLRPQAAEVITDVRLETLDKLAFIRNERLKMPHSAARRQEILALAPDALCQIHLATRSVLAPLLDRWGNA